MPSGARSRVVPTPEQVEAWRHYPYDEMIKPGACLTHAMRLYRLANRVESAADAEARRASEAAQHRKRRIATVEALPDWCYKHEHPMRCGRPGKLYHRNDGVTPLCDALTMMCEKIRRNAGADDAFGLFDEQPRAKRRRKHDGWDEREAAEERAVEEMAAVRSGSAKQPAQWQCENKRCNSRDRKALIQSDDGLCCPCGTFVRGSLNISSETEWRCHADDDRGKNEQKKRADVSRPAKSCAQREIDGESISGKERAKIRGADAKQTSVGGYGHTDAQRIVEQDRARERRKESDLLPREEIKRSRIVEELNKMFKRLKPIDHEVQKKVRTAAHELWLQAVQHSNVCERASCCELRLVDRSPMTIASSVFSHTIDGILAGEITIASVEHEHIVDVQMRMQRSDWFSNSSSLAQMATAKSMISLMQTPGFDSCKPCAPLANPTPPLAIPAEARRHGARGNRFQRCDSDFALGAGESSPAADQLPLRNALGTVFLAHKSTMPASVRDGATRALRAPGFVASCKELPCLRKASLQAMAFCVLNAVAREQADAVGPSFANGSLAESVDVSIAHKLSLDLAVAEEAIAAIRHFVPVDAASEASTPQDDDLFVS
tara:strand:+ start:4051 stop:5868 length:1818 start_codon:yes stop_codon:yes gene_type:complete